MPSRTDKSKRPAKRPKPGAPGVAATRASSARRSKPVSPPPPPPATAPRGRTSSRRTVDAPTAPAADAGRRARLKPCSRVDATIRRGGTFGNEGHFAVASAGRVLWAHPSRFRVGWLDLADGGWEELAATNAPTSNEATCVGLSADGQAAAVGLRNGTVLLIEPGGPTSTRRLAAHTQYPIQAVAVTDAAILTIQPEKRSRRPLVHVFNRASLKLACVIPSAPDVAALASSGTVAIAAPGQIELWTAPYRTPRTVAVAADGPPRGLGVSDDGKLVACLFAAEVVVLDANLGTIVWRVATPPAKGKAVVDSLEWDDRAQEFRTVALPLRRHPNSQSWVRPLPHGRLITVDGAKDAGTSEVVIELWDAATQRRLAHEVITMSADAGHAGLASQIGIGNDVVVINAQRYLRIT